MHFLFSFPLERQSTEASEILQIQQKASYDKGGNVCGILKKTFFKHHRLP